VTALKRLSVASLIIAFGHVVFGAIVRISGSGLGCGDHWPKCHGYWFPPFNRIDLIIEVSHRYFAAGLSLAIVVLVLLALRHRGAPGVSGPDGVLRPAVLSAALVVAAAVFGGVTVKLELTNPYVTVVHLAIAMALLASLATAAIRAGGLGASTVRLGDASSRTARSATIAAGLTFIALALGGLTANVPGANAVCTGFPWCRNEVPWASGALHMQLAHRIIAFLLVGHLIGAMIGVARRREGRTIVALARASMAVVVLQLLVAAALVEMQLPPVLRSLHQAIGTLLWVVTATFALHARRAAVGSRAASADARHGALSTSGSRA
jgi:heme a synthase